MRSRLGGSLVCQWHGSRLLNAAACCMEDQVEAGPAVQPLCVDTTLRQRAVQERGPYHKGPAAAKLGQFHQ